MRNNDVSSCHWPLALLTHWRSIQWPEKTFHGKCHRIVHLFASLRFEGTRKILISRLHTVTKLFHTAVYLRRKHFAWKGTENSRPGNNEGDGMEYIMTGNIIENMIPDRITTGKHLYIATRGYLVPVIGGPRCRSLTFFANHKTLRYIGVLRVSSR
jgi:hypothetical protein